MVCNFNFVFLFSLTTSKYLSYFNSPFVPTFVTFTVTSKYTLSLSMVKNWNSTWSCSLCECVSIPKVTLGKKKKKKVLKLFLFCFKQAPLRLRASGCSAVVLTSGLPCFLPALLPGLKLRHDCVLCAHDLERPDCPHRQREPHRGGAEVGPAGRPAAVGDPGAAWTTQTQCLSWISFRVFFIDTCFENFRFLFFFFWILLKTLLYQ